MKSFRAVTKLFQRNLKNSQFLFNFKSSNEIFIDNWNVDTLEEKKEFFKHIITKMRRNDMYSVSLKLSRWLEIVSEQDYISKLDDEGKQMDACIYAFYGQLLKSLSEYDQSIQMFTKAREYFSSLTIPLDKSSVISVGYCGYIYLEKKDFSGAEDWFLWVLKYYPDEIRTLQSLAMIYEATHQVDKAKPIYEKLAQVEPENPHILADCAVFYSSNELDMDLAEKLFKRSIEILADDQNMCSYGQMLLDQVRLDEAEALYKKASEINPKNYIAFAGLGTIDLMKGDLENAKFNLEFSKNIWIDQPIVLSNLGFIEGKMGNFEIAKGHYEQAITRMKDRDVDTSVYLNFATLLMNNKNFDKSKDILEKGLKFDENEPSLLGNYAVLLTNHFKDHEEAEKMFKKSLQGFSGKDVQGFVNNLHNYCEFLISRSRKEETKEILNEYATRFPEEKILRERQDFMVNHFPEQVKEQFDSTKSKKKNKK